MDAQEVFAHVKDILRSNGMLAMSSSSIGSPVANCSCGIEGDVLLVKVPASYSPNILKKRPRISFTAGPDSQGREIHGNGSQNVPMNPGRSRSFLID